VGAPQAGPLSPATLALIEPPVSDVEVALRIGAALLLGGLIGLEREISHQPAGLRTHIAVAVGAALFGVISVHGFDLYAQDRLGSNYQIDVTRVASQVVVGIGFLGGGTILKHGASIRGLTTAASLWVTAAVGLAAGVGSLMAATITTGALLLSLVGLRAPRERVRRRLARGRATLSIQLRPEADPSQVIHALLDVTGVEVRNLSLSKNEDGRVIEAHVVGPVGVQLSSVLVDIAERSDVADMDID
jgi:putative Mg2+ transporter-C (MgtC) family protein